MFIPRLTGNGQLIRVGKDEAAAIAGEKKIILTMDDVAAEIFLTAGFFVLA